MKRIASYIISAIVLLSLVGCSSNNTKLSIKKNDSKKTSKAEQTASEQENSEKSFEKNETELFKDTDESATSETQAEKMSYHIIKARVTNHSYHDDPYDGKYNLSEQGMIYAFDDDGRITSERESSALDYSGSSPRDIDQLTDDLLSRGTGYDYEYDKTGNLIKKTEYFQGTLMRCTEYEYEFDASGKLIREKHMTDNTCQEYSYEYDGEGKISKKVVPSTSEHTEVYYEYEYDEDGHLVKESCCTEFAGLKSISEWNEYEYDPAGNLIKQSKWDGKRLILEYEFDGQGNKLTETEYDSQGRIVHQSFYEYVFE
ncbi:MAG: hypothetical protein IK106_04425 [Clostridiales bacterium]|nr:hypothetical protein [Clostridiales bacterium]